MRWRLAIRSTRLVQCAEDCAAVFSVIHGRDERDSVTVDAPFVWLNDRNIRDMQIGYVEKEFGDVEGETSRVDREALDVLPSLGAEVEPVSLPRFPSGLMVILWGEAAAAFDELARTESLDLLVNDNSQWPKLFCAARSIPVTEYVRAQRLRNQLLTAFEAFVQDWDAVVCPAKATPTSRWET